MFSKMINLIEEEKYNLIKQKVVLIVGIGGVGGYSVETLVRSGIEKLILIDYDTFELSNINRQLYANINTINKKKIEVAKENILQINPNAKIITIDKKLNKDNINILDKYKIDYIIDACDDIEVKKELIKK